MGKILKIFIFFATLIYPFLVVLKAEFIWVIAVILAILWALNAFFSANISFLIIAAFFVILAFFSEIKFFYPVLVNLIFFIIFISSLKNEAIITKIAKAREPNLPEIAEIYTRNLTKIWAIFFVINGSICAILPLFSENLWLIYTGILSYFLIATLFFSEILYRKIFLKW